MGNNTISITATSNSINFLNSVIHDLHFDLKEIEHIPKKKELKIFFFNTKKKFFCTTSERLENICTLTVKEVRDFKIEETEGIGVYDINYLDYNSGFLRLVSSVPLNFVVELEDTLKIHLRI
jgi:hypothetical protein